MEAQLMALAEAMPYPQTPDLAAGFWRRLEASNRGREIAPAWSLAGVALAAVVVVAAAVIGTLAPAREAAADLFDRINIFAAEETEFTDVTREISGVEVSLGEAEERLGLPIALPTAPAGAKDAITRVVFQEFETEGPPRGIAYVFFEPPEGIPFVLAATNAPVGKGLAPDASAERVDELPGEAYWLQGLRIVEIEDAAGRPIRESRRATDANTLLWEQDGYVYRIEGDLDREEAMAIALSVR
jgi:hypothetical protein